MQHTRHRNSLKSSCAILAMSIGLALAGASAGLAADGKNYNVPAQPLNSALNSFADENGLNIVYDPKLVQGKTSSDVSGSFSKAEALERILQGSGLIVEQRGENTFFIREGKVAEYQDVEAPASDGSSAEEGFVLDEIIVTGSRIKRSGFEMPTPVTSIGRDQIERSGFSNISDVLMRTPSVGIGLGPNNSTYNKDAGATFVNLRGLGLERTLTLVNGRRRVSGSQSSSAVDLGTIPASMIERVEIITGGASAVYGADAVSGLVNVILKEDFEGLEVSGRGGISGHGDAESYSVGMHGGMQFDDGRGHISFGFTHYKDQPLGAWEREHSRRQLDYSANPNNTGPADGIPDNVILSDRTFPVLHYAGTFNIGGTLYTYDPGLRPVESDIFFDGFNASGGDGWRVPDYQLLRIKQQVESAMTTMDYELTDGISFFAEASFANTRALSFNDPVADIGSAVLQRDNPFIPDEVGALMDSFGQSTLAISRMNPDQGVRTSDNERTTYTIAAGFEGEFGSDWEWETFFQYGRYNQTLRDLNARINSRFQAAIDAVVDPVTQEIVCRSATARNAGCAPLNVIGRDAASEEALDYILHTRILNIKNEQTVIGAQTTGTIFELPAGPLSVALGGEYRKDSISTQDDGLAELGLLYAPDNGGKPVIGGVAVYEAFLEVVAPVVKDKPFFHEMNVEGAVRYSNYNTIGTTIAWKLGADWAPTPDIRFRATRSESVRAPNLAELFNPGTAAGFSIIDPCSSEQLDVNPNRVSNCRALGIPGGWRDPLGAVARFGSFGGNLDLQEETSTSFTIGTVITPRAIPGLHMSIDYWNIKIADAVQTPNPSDIVSKCVDLSDINNVFCSLITRGGAVFGGDEYTISNVNVADINIGKLSARGVDWQIEYNFTAASLIDSWNGDITLNLTGTYLDKLEELVDPTEPNSLLVEDGEGDDPHWRANFDITYVNGPLAVNWNMRYIGSAVADVQLPERYEDPEIAAKIYNDLFISYDLTDRYNVFLGINNVFDEIPPRNPLVFRNGFGDGALHDNIGRYFFVGGKFRF